MSDTNAYANVARKSAAVLAVLLVVTSGIGPMMSFSPVTTASAAQNDTKDWQATGTEVNLSDWASEQQGIYQDGNGNWYIINGSAWVHKFDSDFTHLNQYNLSGDFNGNAEDIYYQGGNWYSIDTSQDVVEVYDSSFNHVTTHDVSTEDGYMTGLWYNGSNWLLTGANNNNIYVYDSNWNFQTSHNIGSETANPDDIYQENDETYILDDGSIYVYNSSDFSYTGDSNSISGINAPDGQWVSNKGYWWVGSQSDGTFKQYYYGRQTVSGQVVNQYGEPVSNATVQYWAVNTSAVNPDPGETVQEAARDRIQNYSDPVPSSWDRSLDLNGMFSDMQSQGGNYVAVTKGSISGSAWFDSGDLSQPILTADADEELVLTAWDADGGQGLTTVQGEYDSQLPGTTLDDTRIVIESVSPTGETVDRRYVETDESAGGGYLDPSELQYAKVQLSSGFYRVYPEGSPGSSYIIKVGEPVRAFFNNLQNQTSGTITKQAEVIQSDLNSNVLQSRTVQADANGSFAASLTPNYETIAIQAYRAGGTLGPDSSFSDVRNTSASSYNGSVVLSTTPTVSEVPNSGVEVTVYEFTSPPYQNLTSMANRYDWLQNLLENESYSNLPPALQQRLNNTSDQEMQQVYDQLSDLSQQNDRLESRVQELLGQDEDIYINSSDGSNAELRERIRALQQALTELRDTVDSGEPTSSVGQNEVSLSFPFDTNLQPQQVAVLVHYSNGTTKTLDTSSQYVTVANQVGGDEVRVENYPLGNSSAAVANFEVQVANSEGTGSAEKRVTNPSFSGEVPTMQSVELSSMRPGPNETVRMQLHPQDDIAYGQLESIKVYGPSGQTVPANVINNRTANFTTSGAGVYTVRAKYTNAGNQSFVLTPRVEAGETDVNQPPSVRAVSSPVGVYAIASDGLDGGDVEIKSGGSQATLVAQLPQNADIPPEVHYYTAGSGLAPDNTLTVRVVRGEQRQSISTATRAIIHTSSLPDGAQVRRNGDPLPQGEEMPYGTVKNTNNGTLINTVTDSNGVADVRTNANPGIIEQVKFKVEVLVPDISTPTLFMGGLGGGVAGANLAFAFVVPFGLLKRRWSS